MRVVYWGTYDKGKPRNRILIEGLKQNDVQVIECHKSVWHGCDDKSQITGFASKVKFTIRWIVSYPALIWRYLALPRHDAVVVGYLGQIDVLILWLFAKLRGVPIVWDAFLSLYDTVVDDRALLSRGLILSRGIYALEWLACQAADVVVLDTAEHAKYFQNTFKLSSEKVFSVFVGAEASMFSDKNKRDKNKRDKNKRDKNKRDNFTVLFYGQFIPLHGVQTIIGAARLLEGESIDFVLIGKGQQSGPLRAELAANPISSLTWLDWVEYEDLMEWIDRADLCLGIFGDSAKAGRVIPNKVFQVLLAGKPVITRDSLAIRELLSEDMPGVWLVSPAQPRELSSAIYNARKCLRDFSESQLHKDLYTQISEKGVGENIRHVIERCVFRREGGDF